jgi:twitching motility protein PilT
VLGRGWAAVALGVRGESDYGAVNEEPEVADALPLGAGADDTGEIPLSTAAAEKWPDVEPHLDAWLELLAGLGGTDILLTAGSAPLLRVDGKLLPLPGAEALDSEKIESITRSQFPSVGGAGKGGRHFSSYNERLDIRKELDFSFTWRDQGRVRANAFYQRGNCSLSLRYIPMRVPTPDELGLPEAIVSLMRSPSGLILVTGPTGSGKSTSMASLIDSINYVRPCHIVTIEDPIEYMFTNRMAAVSQREVGNDTESFEAALRSVLREDPDVVLVGEMRDLESIAACLTIAETGHLVFATLHTNDSGQALDRIIDVFPAERRPQIQVQLAGTLLAVIYQRLLPRRTGGLVAAYEVMMGVPAVRNLIREGKTRQLRNTLVTHRADGMQTLEQHLTELVNGGVIEWETAIDASLYPKDIPKPDLPPEMAPVPVGATGAGAGESSSPDATKPAPELTGAGAARWAPGGTAAAIEASARYAALFGSGNGTPANQGDAGGEG